MNAATPQRLGVNIDHVATIRNARGGRHPDPSYPELANFHLANPGAVPVVSAIVVGLLALGVWPCASGSKCRAVHGWIIGSSENDGIVVPEGQPIPGAPEVKLQNTDDKAAYGRPLAMSTTAIIPFLDDDPATLDADVRN